MKLIESLPKIDKNQVINIIYPCMDNLSSVSPDFLLTKDDFEDNSSRFTKDAFGAGTYYIDNMQLHL